MLKCYAFVLVAETMTMSISFAVTDSDEDRAIADVVAFGRTVFRNSERFDQWAAIPHRRLGGRRPIAMIFGSREEREEVERLLGRIEHSVYG